MGKLALFGTTLVAAVPAAFIGYLFFTFLTQYSGNARGGLQALAWSTLVVAVVPVVLPIVALLTGGPAARAKPKAKAGEASAAADKGDVATAGEFGDAEELGEVEELGSGDVEAFDDTGEFDSGDEVETASGGEFEVFEEDDQKK